SGDAALAARGEFIQLRCQAARLPLSDPGRAPLEHRAGRLREQHEEAWLGSLASEVDGWDFERGLGGIEVRPGARRWLESDRLLTRPEWFWVIGVKGVLLERRDVERLSRSPLAEQLTALELGDCFSGPLGARVLAESGRLARLSCLRLGYNFVGDAGAAALAD